MGFEQYADPNCRVCYGFGGLMDRDGIEYPCYRCTRGKVPSVSDLRVHRPSLKPEGWDQRALIPIRDMREMDADRLARLDCTTPPAEQSLRRTHTRADAMTPGQELVSRVRARAYSEFKTAQRASSCPECGREVRRQWCSNSKWHEARLTESRPSFREFPTDLGIRESSERPAEPGQNFSNIQAGTPDGTDPWENPEYVTGYHNVPTEDRARVFTHGLIASLPRRNPVWDERGEGGMVQRQPEGVYLSRYPNVFHNNFIGKGVDLYEVRVHPSKLINDPLTGSWVHTESIPPEQVKMFRPFNGAARRSRSRWPRPARARRRRRGAPAPAP